MRSKYLGLLKCLEAGYHKSWNRKGSESDNPYVETPISILHDIATRLDIHPVHKDAVSDLQVRNNISMETSQNEWEIIAGNYMKEEAVTYYCSKAGSFVRK